MVKNPIALSINVSSIEAIVQKYAAFTHYATEEEKSNQFTSTHQDVTSLQENKEKEWFLVLIVQNCSSFNFKILYGCRKINK